MSASQLPAPPGNFRADLPRHFKIQQAFLTGYNWKQSHDLAWPSAAIVHADPQTRQGDPHAVLASHR